MSILETPPGVQTERAGSATLSEFGYRSELRRSLSLVDLLVYGLVFIVPIAPFAIFGIVFNASKGMVPLTYLIGLVAMMFTALSYREMSRAFPIAGSVYAYAGRGISPTAGFLAGWAILLDYLLIPTLCYVIGAAAMRSIVPQIPQPIWVIGFVVFNTAINLRGIETTARASKIFLAGELIVLAVFVVLGAIAVTRGVNGAHWSIAPFFAPEVFHVGLIFSALSVAVLSFLGFDAISTLAEEAKGGVRVVGQATMIALCLVAVLVHHPDVHRGASRAGANRVRRRHGDERCVLHDIGDGGRRIVEDARGRIGRPLRGDCQLARRAGGDGAFAVFDGPRWAVTAVSRARPSGATRPRARGAPRVGT